MFQDVDTLLLEKISEGSVLLIYRSKNTQQIMVDAFDPNRFRNSHSWIGTLKEFIANLPLQNSLIQDFGENGMREIMSTVNNIK